MANFQCVDCGHVFLDTEGHRIMFTIGTESTLRTATQCLGCVERGRPITAWALSQGILGVTRGYVIDATSVHVVTSMSTVSTGSSEQTP